MTDAFMPVWLSNEHHSGLLDMNGHLNADHGVNTCQHVHNYT